MLHCEQLRELQVCDWEGVLCGAQELGLLQVLVHDYVLPSGGIPQELLTVEGMRGFGLVGGGGQAAPPPQQLGGDVRSALPLGLLFLMVFLQVPWFVRRCLKAKPVLLLLPNHSKSVYHFTFSQWVCSWRHCS